jgi:hypothetical protein
MDRSKALSGTLHWTDSTASSTGWDGSMTCMTCCHPSLCTQGCFADVHLQGQYTALRVISSAGEVSGQFTWRSAASAAASWFYMAITTWTVGA